MVEEIYDMLVKGGPWGIITLLIVAVVWLARDTLKQRDANKKQLETQYHELFEMLEKKIEAEVNHTSALKELRTSLEKLIENTAGLKELRKAVDKLLEKA